MTDIDSSSKSITAADAHMGPFADKSPYVVVSRSQRAITGYILQTFYTWAK